MELAGIGPTSFAGMLLAELGADVVKVDRPAASGFGVPPEYDLLNRGRPSVCVDLKQPAGVELVHRLVDSTDVLIEGYRPGVAERLGLGPDELCQRRPQLVYGRMTGWGQDGPLAQRAGHDLTYLALTGALHAIGPRAAPSVPLNLVGDFGGGALYLVVGVLAALLEARASGRGQVVDAAIVDGATHLSTMTYGLLAAGLWSDRRQANLIDGGTPFYDVYETSDGRHMAVGPLEPQFYAEFERLLALPESLPERTDTRRWAELRATIAGRFATRTQAEWSRHFADSDACVAPVLPMTEAAQHPHVSERETLVEYEGVLQPAPAPRFSRTVTALSSPPQLPGSQSREALQHWGIDDVSDLLAAGVVLQPADETRASAAEVL